MYDSLDSTSWRTAVRDLPAAFARHREYAPDASVDNALAAITAARVDALLVISEGTPHVLTPADLDRVLPSPATALARYEIRELLHRVTLRYALREPARVIDAAARC